MGLKQQPCDSNATNQLTFTCSKSTIETLKECEICSKLTIKTPERRHWNKSIFDVSNNFIQCRKWKQKKQVLCFITYQHNTKKICFGTRRVFFVKNTYIINIFKVSSEVFEGFSGGLHMIDFWWKIINISRNLENRAYDIWQC